jgi:hypothetical protein
VIRTVPTNAAWFVVVLTGVLRVRRDDPGTVMPTISTWRRTTGAANYGRW